MPIVRLKSDKAIVLSFSNHCKDIIHSDYDYIGSNINKTEIRRYCKSNDIQLLKFIEFKRCCESERFVELLELIKRLKKPPVLIIKANVIHVRTQIMTCSVLAVLTILELAHVYFCLKIAPKKNNSTIVLVHENNPKRLLLLAEAYTKKAFLFPSSGC